MSEIDTPAAAAAAGARVMVRCADCGRCRYVRTALPPDTPFADIAAGMACHRCLSPAVSLVAVLPEPGTGRWPAERG